MSLLSSFSAHQSTVTGFPLYNHTTTPHHHHHVPRNDSHHEEEIRSRIAIATLTHAPQLPLQQQQFFTRPHPPYIVSNASIIQKVRSFTTLTTSSSSSPSTSIKQPTAETTTTTTPTPSTTPPPSSSSSSTFVVKEYSYPELTIDAARHKAGLLDPNIPTWQNPLHHNNALMQRTFPKDFPSREAFEAAIIPMAPLHLTTTTKTNTPNSTSNSTITTTASASTATEESQASEEGGGGESSGGESSGDGEGGNPGGEGGGEEDESYEAVAAKTSKHLVDLAEEIVLLNMLEMSELINKIADHYGFHEGMLSPDGAAAGSFFDDDADDAAAAAPVLTKSSFDIKLVAFDGASKIKIIKEVRSLASLGLKEAKEMVESAPKMILKDIKAEEAEAIKTKLEELGATIELS